MKLGKTTMRISALGLWVACGSFLCAGKSGAGEPVFLRGDCNADGQLSISDVIFVHQRTIDELPCPKAMDLNDDGRLPRLPLNWSEEWPLHDLLFSPVGSYDFP